MNHVMNPEIDLDLKSSNCCGLELSLGMLASWGPQLASHMAETVDEDMGNLAYASNSEFCVLEKVNPKSLVPIKYLITYFTWSICCGVGLDMYFERMLVMTSNELLHGFCELRLIFKFSIE